MTGPRKLGPVLATMIVAGNMIGSGIFLLPATLAGVGSLTILGWIIGTLGALALALLFSKLARRKPLAGGPATYAFDAFGPFWGSQSSRGTGRRASSATSRSRRPRAATWHRSSGSMRVPCSARSSRSSSCGW